MITFAAILVVLFGASAAIGVLGRLRVWQRMRALRAQVYRVHEVHDSTCGFGANAPACLTNRPEPAASFMTFLPGVYPNPPEVNAQLSALMAQAYGDDPLPQMQQQQGSFMPAQQYGALLANQQMQQSESALYAIHALEQAQAQNTMAPWQVGYAHVPRDSFPTWHSKAFPLA